MGHVVKGHVDIHPAAMKKAKAALHKAPKKIKQHRLSFGIHETEGKASKVKYDGNTADMDLVVIATIHEMGLAGQVERSWLRSWYDTNAGRHSTELKEAMKREYQGDRDALKDLARRWLGELQTWLQDNTAHLAPLAATTVAARRAHGLAEGPPMVATGQLLRALRAIVDGEKIGT